MNTSRRRERVWEGPAQSQLLGCETGIHVSFAFVTDLQARGFEGFATVAELRASSLGGVPSVCGGTYVVVRTKKGAPRFLGNL